MSIIDQLDKLAWWLGHKHSNPSLGHLVRLSAEDIHQELMAEVVIASVRYSDLPRDKLLYVAKRCMYNRMKDLLRREYGTWRGDGTTVSLEMYDGPVTYDPDEWIDLKSKLQSLSDTAQAIVNVLLEGSDRLTFELILADMRRAYVYKKGRYKLSVKPFMLARALGVDIDDVMVAIDEIKDALRQD